MPFLFYFGLLAAAGATSLGADLVREGQALGSVWHRSDDPAAPPAVEDLVRYIEAMSRAKIEAKAVAEGGAPTAGEPAIIVARLALDLGLSAPPKTPSFDGYALATKGNHLLLAGESAASHRFAVTHFLERLGYRWLMGGKWGEEIPERKTIPLDGSGFARARPLERHASSVRGFETREAPDFIYRYVWGADAARIRTGGMDLPNRHDWEHCPPERYFRDHPEYFALRGGERRPGQWVCTSHPDVARIFADAYIAKARQGIGADTISPPDGRGFCECERCRALDVPDAIEPSSGTISMSDRFVRFFDDVGKLVAEDAPGFTLSFYCYSDYTLPPRRIRAVSPNLCGWVTTIRFCRIHGAGNPICESRRRYRAAVEGWASLMRTACYDYNYNLAEVTVPISKITTMRENIPFLKRTGCLGINLESMAAWNLYAPHTYLAARLMWDADADADAILKDFFDACGGRAAPHLAAYWERIDRACREADVHVGSFYGVHAIWTPGLVRACEADLDAAARAADTEMTRGRVALFRSGLESAKYYLAVREALSRCEFAKAKETFDRWMAHMDDAFDREYNTMRGYKRGYAEWFILPVIASGLERTTGPRRLLSQLPDEWEFRYDPNDAGEKEGFFAEAVPPEGWRRVRTYSASLNEQKILEELTWMWYRTSFPVPAELPPGPLHLWFGEIDGSPTRVYVNGEFAGEFTGARRPGEVEVTGRLRPGRKNLVAIKTGHHGISEILLGGILRPAMIYAGPKPDAGAGRPKE